MDFDATIRQLQDTLVVVTAVQERQAAVQRLQAEELDAAREHLRIIRAGQELHEQRMKLFDEKMLEIEDKLNGLIGYLDRQKPS